MGLCNVISWLALAIFLAGTDSLMISWDPYNPLFSCKDPVVNVKQDDLLSFICPDVTLSRNPQEKTTELYEKALLLGSKQVNDYLNCNATVHSGVLASCVGQYEVTKHFASQYQVTPNALTFRPGKIYYAVSTSFRTTEHVNDLVGGSCNYSSPNGAHPLKLKIRVCTESEIESGDCVICDSEPCIYKDCQKSCSEWITSDYIQQQNVCFRMEKRLCNNTILKDLNKEEYQKVSIECAVTCSEWVNIVTVQRDGQCFSTERRFCNDTLTKSPHKDYREIPTKCPRTCSQWFSISTSQRSGNCFRLERRFCNNTALQEFDKQEYQEIQIDCQKTCSHWTRKNSFRRDGQCFDNEIRLCNDSALQQFDKEEYKETLQDCQKVCSNWTATNSFVKDNQCFSYEERKCNVSMLEQLNLEETRKVVIDCDEICTNWLHVSYIVHEDDACFSLEKRSCFFNTVDQHRERPTQCTQRSQQKILIGTGAAKKSSDGDDDGGSGSNNFKYMLIPIIIVALIVGFVLGGFCYRYHQNKNKNKRHRTNNITPEVSVGTSGNVNRAFKAEPILLNEMDTPELRHWTHGGGTT